MGKYFRITITHSVLVWGVLLMIIPLWLIFASSTHSNSIIYNEGMQWKVGGELIENYDRVLNKKGGFTKEITASKIFLNSFIMAFGIATLSVIVSMMAAYSLVYFKTKFSSFFFWAIFITLLVPLELRILPSYQIVSDLNLTNSYAGLILPLSASAIATFFFRQYFRSIPDELLEAARMDAASEWSIYWKIVFPLALPAIAVLGILSIIWRWNDLILPMIAVSTTKTAYTIQLCLLDFQGEYVAQEHYRLAMTVVSLIPTTLVFVFLQRYITSGIASTGIK